MGIFENIFTPGTRYRDEEKTRLALSREEIGEGQPGRGPIDLDSGSVVIRRPVPEDAQSADDSDTVPSDTVPSSD